MKSLSTRFLARVVVLLAIGLSVCFGIFAERADAQAAPASANGALPSDMAFLAAALRTSIRATSQASQGAYLAVLAARKVQSSVPVKAAAAKAVGAAKLVSTAPKPAPKPAVVAKTPAKPAASQPVRAAAAPRPRVLASYVLRATGYNSLRGQTDHNPFITATGARTRFGIIALSRDMLRRIPYGSVVRIEDLSGRFNYMLRNMSFVVEDTMHPRKYGTVDIWFPAYGQAISWGVRQVRLTVLRYGRG